MTKSIRFTKIHGAGNGYIYISTMVYLVDSPEESSIAWSKPHTDIGSDGLVLIGSLNIADFSMHIYSAGGSETIMCGNTSRCIGKYVYEAGLTQKNKVTLETLSGIKELQLKVECEEIIEVTADMGMPAVGEIALEVEAGREIYTGTAVSVGNPHLVIFVDEMDKVDLVSVGSLLECLPLFPDRTNVEFVQVLKPDEIRMKVRERGFGITQACGTRACAAAVAGVVRGKTKREAKVIMDGGSLAIEWDEQSGKVFITGGAVSVFEGFIKV